MGGVGVMDIFKKTKQIIDDNRPESAVGEGKGGSRNIESEGCFKACPIPNVLVL